MTFLTSRYSHLYELCLLLAVCIGATFLSSIGNGIDRGEWNGIIGSALCAAVASVYQRRLGPSILPDGALYATWAVFVTFSIFSIFIFMVQLQSSRRVVIIGFMVSLAVLVCLHVLRNRFTLPCFVAIPGGRLDLENNNISASWHALTDNFPKKILKSSAYEDRFDDELLELTDQKRVSGLVADLHHDHPNDWRRLMVRSVMNGYPVFHFRELEEMYTGKISIDFLSENQFGSTLPYKPYLPFKMVFEFLITLLLLPLLLTLMLVISLLVLIGSGRPIFFRQQRVGYRGRPFTIWKFRTMDAEPDEPHQPSGKKSKRTKTKNSIEELLANQDNQKGKVTGIGHFLRKHRLDEVPQFLNVLKGELSWVGPRPETVELVEKFHGTIRFFSYRHSVFPGITGWAQINQGHVSTEAEAVEKLRYDFYYLKHFSPWLDFVIIARTIGVVLKGKTKFGL